jgi:hypothetical protein
MSDSSSRGTLIMAAAIGSVVVAFMGISIFGLLAFATGIGSPGAPRAYHMPAGPTEAEVAGVRLVVDKRGWYGGGYMAFMYAVRLPERYSGWTVTPVGTRAETPDGRGYDIADALPLGTVDAVAVGAFTLRLPEAGKGVLTITVPALRVVGPQGAAEEIAGPWAVSPVELFGEQPNRGTRIGSSADGEIRHGEAHLALAYKDLAGCPGSFEVPATPTPSAPAQPTPTPYAGPEPGPTSTRAPLPPPYLRGIEPDGTFIMAASVCSPVPRHMAVRVTGPKGGLEPATVP